MGFAVQMNLNSQGAPRIRAVWEGSAARGITAEMLPTDPHISLAAINQVDPEKLRPVEFPPDRQIYAYPFRGEGEVPVTRA